MIHLVTVTHFPERIFLERGIFQQSVNCEFRLQNDSNEVLELYEIDAEGFDEQDRLLFRLPLNSLGLTPPILIVPERKIEAGKLLEIFNPIPNFALDYAIHRLSYQFKFRTEKGSQLNSEITLQPVLHEQKATLILPFAGICMVTEGHDFLTHHRRNFPFTHPLIQQIGITGNNSRFAYDFVFLDDELHMFDHAPSRNEDFFCWAKPVLCPGDGTVVSMINDLPDNAFNTPAPFDVEAHIRNPNQEMMKHCGNHLLIDHGNNEYSLLAHMQKGSVQAKLGDKVTKGQQVGRVGTSGDSFFPHIHYQLQNGRAAEARGVAEQV